MTFTKKQIETILNKWKTPANTKKIAQDPKGFFKAIKMSVGTRTGSFSPFITKGMEAGVKEWSVADFKKYTDIAAKILRESGANIDNLRTTFTAFKKVVKKYHDESGARWKSLQHTMSLTPAEKKVWTTRSSDAIKRKNENQLVLTEQDAEKFINTVSYAEDSDVIDRIISCQVCAGLRMIEVLSSKVSTFAKAPDEQGQHMIKQIGVAKHKSAKDKDGVVIDKRTVTMPLVMITPKRFLENIKVIREAVGDIKGVSNQTLGKRWNPRINKRIKLYLKELGMEEHPEISTSHGMRRLYINFAFANRKNRNMSLMMFISKYLGHDPKYVSAAAANYSSILIETASVLTDSQSAQVNQAQSRSIENKEELSKLKKKMKDIPVTEEKAPAPEEPVKVKFVSAKEKKFEKISNLVKKGVTSYSQMQKNGISTYTYSQWKKSQGITPEPEREEPGKTVAQAVKELKKKGKSPTYANLRTYGFTNAQIKSFKDKN